MMDFARRCTAASLSGVGRSIPLGEAVLRSSIDLELLDVPYITHSVATFVEENHGEVW